MCERLECLYIVYSTCTMTFTHIHVLECFAQFSCKKNKIRPHHSFPKHLEENVGTFLRRPYHPDFSGPAEAVHWAETPAPLDPPPVSWSGPWWHPVPAVGPRRECGGARTTGGSGRPGDGEPPAGSQGHESSPRTLSTSYRITSYIKKNISISKYKINIVCLSVCLSVCVYVCVCVCVWGGGNPWLDAVCLLNSV